MNDVTTTAAAPGARGLADVPNVVLPEVLEQALDRALAACGGGRPWRQRKAHEARDILALSVLAPPGRMTVRALDASAALRAMIRLDCPVACRAEGGSDVIVHRGVDLGLSYPQEVLSEALPGYAFIEILAPHRVFHPNVAPEPEQVQRLCLGTTLPARIRCVNLLAMAYDALRMHEVQDDEYDAAGVLNLDAARHWQVSRDQLPLSPLAFLE